MNFAIVYFSRSGHTKEMGELIAKGLEKNSAQVRLFDMEQPADADYINSCAGVIFGTPTYAANVPWQVIRWFFEGCQGVNLAGKLGGMYSTAHYAQGGADVAIMSLVPELLVRGMLLYSGGSAYGKPILHLGPVALDSVEGHYEACKPEFEIFGERFAGKAAELFDK